MAPKPVVGAVSQGEQEPPPEPKGHGGKRQGAGRRVIGGGPRGPITVWLSPDEAAYLAQIGNGNTSAGIRALIERDRKARP